MIPYLDVLLPYHVHLAGGRTWRFACACEQSELERNVVSLDVNKSIYEKFHSIGMEACMSKTKTQTNMSTKFYL